MYRFAGHYVNETFLLKFYPIGALNMNYHLAMESSRGIILVTAALQKTLITN